MQTVSVSTLNDQIKSLLEVTFLQVAVIGEISRVTYHNSGHIYFSLKDENSQISAVMFRGNALKLKFRLKDGIKVIIFGAITLYKPRGQYQINVSHIQAEGAGNLALAFKQLKEKLSSKGFFDVEKKRVKPRVISSIAIITSSTSAALQDILRLISKRWPMLKITLIDVLVQGEKASKEISSAIQYADTLLVDAILISRGGGSIEDLWAFNEENVATSLFNAQTFTLSAVGHEIDWVISDYVADLRAATPTAAMEMLLLDQWEVHQNIDNLRNQFNIRMNQILQVSQKIVYDFKNRISTYSIQNRLKIYKEDIQTIKLNFLQFFKQIIDRKNIELKEYHTQLDQNFLVLLARKEQYLDFLKKAFSQANLLNEDKEYFVELSKNGEKIKISKLDIDDNIQISNSKIVANAKIMKIERL